MNGGSSPLVDQGSAHTFMANDVSKRDIHSKEAQRMFNRLVAGAADAEGNSEERSTLLYVSRRS